MQITTAILLCNVKYSGCGMLYVKKNIMLFELKKAILVYGNMFLVKNTNNQMMLLDSSLNKISKEYDRIIVGQDVDLVEMYSSYY